MAIIKPKSNTNESVIIPELVDDTVPDTAPNVSLVPPISTTLRSEAESLLSAVVMEAEMIEVVDQESDDLAADFLSNKVKRGLLLIDRMFDPNIKRWLEGHRAAIKEKRELSEQFNKAKEIVKEKIKLYRIKVREEERRQLSKLQEELKQEAAEVTATKVISLLSTGKEEDKQKADKLIDKLTDGNVPVNVPMKPVLSVKGPKSAKAPSRLYLRFDVLDPNKINDDYMINVPNLELIQGTMEALSKTGKSFSEIEETIGKKGAIRVYEHESITVRKPEYDKYITRKEKENG